MAQVTKDLSAKHNAFGLIKLSLLHGLRRPSGRRCVSRSKDS